MHCDVHYIQSGHAELGFAGARVGDRCLMPAAPPLAGPLQPHRQEGACRIHWHANPALHPQAVPLPDNWQMPT